MVVPHHHFESLLKKKIIKFYDQGAQHILSMGGTRHKLGNTKGNDPFKRTSTTEVLARNSHGALTGITMAVSNNIAHVFSELVQKAPVNIMRAINDYSFPKGLIH